MFLLSRNRDEAITTGLAAGLLPSALAGRVEVAVRSGIAESRSLARRAGVSRLEAEAASMGVSIANANRAVVARLAQDAARARHYAARYARAWLGQAKGESASQAAAAATKATAARLETIGTSEASGSFNEGRRRVLETLGTIHLMKMWDSAMEKTTCSRCWNADGTMVGHRENFPLGEPGAVHPRCLCTWHLVTVEEVRS